MRDLHCSAKFPAAVTRNRIDRGHPWRASPGSILRNHFIQFGFDQCSRTLIINNLLRHVAAVDNRLFQSRHVESDWLASSCCHRRCREQHLSAFLCRDAKALFPPSLSAASCWQTWNMLQAQANCNDLLADLQLARRPMSDLFSKSSAILSDCGKYRYRLDREWEISRSKVTFLMLNPSTADASEDDPTIRRCIGFAKAWGYGGLIVGNLFALRSTEPKALYSHVDPVGPDNDKHLHAIAQSSVEIVCAWGTHGIFKGRDRIVYNMLELCNLSALKVTAAGHPGHPLYIASATKPKAYYMTGTPSPAVRVVGISFARSLVLPCTP